VQWRLPAGIGQIAAEDHAREGTPPGKAHGPALPDAEPAAEGAAELAAEEVVAAPQEDEQVQQRDIVWMAHHIMDCFHVLGAR
jgi:hypothetical protein